MQLCSMPSTHGLLKNCTVHVAKSQGCPHRRLLQSCTMRLCCMRLLHGCPHRHLLPCRQPCDFAACSLRLRSKRLCGQPCSFAACSKAKQCGKAAKWTKFQISKLRQQIYFSYKQQIIAVLCNTTLHTLSATTNHERNYAQSPVK